MRCGQCGHFKNPDCVNGIVNPENDNDLAYTCLNLPDNIMPDHNTIEDQVNQLRVQRSNLQKTILNYRGPGSGLLALNEQISKITETIIRLNMVDPDATPVIED